IVLDDFHDQIAVADYAARLSRVDDVPAVLSSAGVYVSGRRMAPGQPEMANDTGTYLTVATDLDPFSPEGSEQLEQLRAVPAPAPTLFTGAAAVNADSLDALGSKLLLAGLLIALAT
ncbi:MMPL family transporter, partial [Nocardia farcinica]|nr:MMPL family transporter [Nocardia farcinica]